MPHNRPGEPWLSFLTDLDAVLEAPTDFHCIGGFVVSRFFRERFETELEPYITGPTRTWNRTTLKMWVDACWPLGL